VSAIDTREETFRRLYESHYGAVMAYCRRRVDAATAQDATAEVFMTVWRRMDALPEAAKIRPWLYGIAYRVVGHQWRSRHRYGRLRARVAGVSPRFQPGPEALAVQRAQDRQLLEAARRLRPADQEILRLAGWEELGHTEIASILGISVAAVDQRFHRAKRRLAAEYDRIVAPRAPERARREVADE